MKEGRVPKRLEYFLVFAFAGAIGSVLAMPITLALGQSVVKIVLVWTLITVGGGSVILSQALAARSLNRRNDKKPNTL